MANLYRIELLYDQIIFAKAIAGLGNQIYGAKGNDFQRNLRRYGSDNRPKE